MSSRRDSRHRCEGSHTGFCETSLYSSAKPNVSSYEKCHVAITQFSPRMSVFQQKYNVIIFEWVTEPVESVGHSRCTSRIPHGSSKCGITFQPHYTHDDVIKWKHFPHNWPFVRGIHRSPVNSPHKGQWRGALMLSLICAWINDWVNNREAGDLRRNRVHYDVIVM